MTDEEFKTEILKRMDGFEEILGNIYLRSLKSSQYPSTAFETNCLVNAHKFQAKFYDKSVINESHKTPYGHEKEIWGARHDD